MVASLPKVAPRGHKIHNFVRDSQNHLSRWHIACIYAPMRRFALFIFLCSCGISFLPAMTEAGGSPKSSSRFYYNDPTGRCVSAPIVRHYWPARIVHPLAKVDPKIDSKLRRAASIAQERACAHSKARCWRYVKEALVAAGAVKSYPKTAYAAEAGGELVHSYGFRRLPIHDPYSAPVGAVLVYGNKRRGHVEIRTRDGFVSDYHSRNACFYPLVAVYAKFS